MAEDEKTWALSCIRNNVLDLREGNKLATATRPSTLTLDMQLGIETIRYT